jgi:hypothetical protein
MTTDNEIPLHIQQAEGLRALAEMIEQHPEIAKELSYALHNILSPIVRSNPDPRGTLLTFHGIAKASGAETGIENGVESCSVQIKFGPVAVKVYAPAARMAGQKPAPKYAPLLASTSDKAA